ncbi:MAG: hypothetical protein Q4A00_01270 [Flavobacteriaceae bacterium]|nr:hypothetical protein [Flavobacteriaceae bacterium]
MNTRILDIVKNTEALRREDLKLLASEIEKYPYMQSLRAIYLLGTHQYENENFQKELTKTAAYTTDKRILYHLINVKKEQFIRDEKPFSPKIEPINKESENIDIQEEETIISSEKLSEVDENENITIHNEEDIAISEVIETESVENISSSEEEKQALTGIDFYIRNQPQTEQPKKEIIPPKPPAERPKPVYTTSIMDFYTKHLNKTEEVENLFEEEQEEKLNSTEEKSSHENPIHQDVEEKESKEVENYDWKPMQFDQPFSSPKKENLEPAQHQFDKELIETEENIKPTELASEVKTEFAPPKEEASSNVSAFINTWQNWLKIDRTPQISEQEKKAAIIDKFIENNPKISPIKDNVDFVVKEKSDDISHLMTETLAQLYVEQKLYTKAINAYKILQEKYPEKSAEFEQKIEEIKQTRHSK